jgi:uncharacterized protein (DUF1684 family)
MLDAGRAVPTNRAQPPPPTPTAPPLRPRPQLAPLDGRTHRRQAPPVSLQTGPQSEPTTLLRRDLQGPPGTPTRAGPEFLRELRVAFDRQREGWFSGLTYFPVDPAPTLRVPFHPATGTVEIAPSTGLPRRYHPVGTVDATLGDQVFHVAVPDGGDDRPFRPCRDATSGADTYEDGPYLPVKVHDDGTATVDFNLARNPWCAYDKKFGCPLPPPENAIPVPIRAGEKSLG